MSIALPSLRIHGCDFELNRQEVAAPEAGGRLVTLEIAPSLWMAAYSTEPPSEAEYDAWRTWFDQLDGASDTFFGQDVRRRMPANYKSGFAGLNRFGGGAFDGTATSWSLPDPTFPELVTLNGFPSQFQLAANDYLSFQWDVSNVLRFSLHRMMINANTGGDGAVTTNVRPRVFNFIPSNALVTINAPFCTMRVIPGTRRCTANGKRRSVSFEARQHLVK